MKLNTIIQGDCLAVLKTLPDESVDCVVTSPPYWALRDYGVVGQLGLEETPQKYVKNLCSVFDEVKRVLKKEGTCFVNIGDTYYGGGRNRCNHNPKVKSKSVRGLVDLGDTVPGPKGQSKAMAQIPSRFAIVMADHGWILRNEIIWHKPNCMPASVKDRFTNDFEKVFFFVKSKSYYFKQQFDAANYDGRKDTKYKGGPKDMAGGAHERWQIVDGKRMKNKRSVWSIPTKPLKEAHFATYPEALIEPMIDAGCPAGGIVLDPFFGAGTTGLVAKKQNKNYIGIELNTAYIEIAERRLVAVLNTLFDDTTSHKNIKVVK